MTPVPAYLICNLVKKDNCNSLLKRFHSIKPLLDQSVSAVFMTDDLQQQAEQIEDYWLVPLRQYVLLQFESLEELNHFWFSSQYQSLPTNNDFNTFIYLDLEIQKNLS